MTDPKGNNIGRDTRHSVVIWWARHNFVQRGLLPAMEGCLTKARNTSQNVGNLEWMVLYQVEVNGNLAQATLWRYIVWLEV